MNLSQVILRPVLTEKSVSQTGSGKYTFLVHNEATKVDVKMALNDLYGVHVDKVNITKQFPKFRLGRGRRPMQKKADGRKATVTLKAGEALDLTKLKADKTKK